MTKTILSLCCAVQLGAGCARFTTTQREYRYKNGIKAGEITTKAAATTFFESKSALANFKASQSEKTQSAAVGSLSQETSGTNTAGTISALADLLRLLKTP